VLLALARQLLYFFPEPIIAQHQAGVQLKQPPHSEPPTPYFNQFLL